MPLFDPRTVAQIPLALVLLTWAVVVIEYWARWEHRAEQPLPLLRHPVALLALAWRRLWRNRSLLWWVLGLSLATWAYNSFILRPRMFRSYGMPSGITWWNFQAPNSPLSSLLTAVPYRLEEVLPGWGASPIHSLFSDVLGLVPLILGVALLYVSRRRPVWLAPGLQRRAASLGFLSLGCTVLVVATAVIGQRTEAARSAHLARSVGLGWGLAGLFLQGVGLLPWVVLTWSLVWQVARGGRWSLRQAVRDLLQRGWVALPVVVAMEVFFGARVGLAWLAGTRWTLPLLLVPEPLLFLLPWIVVGERAEAAGIWREVVALWRYRYADLGLFLLRFGALFLPVRLIFDLLNQMSGALAVFPHVLFMLAQAALAFLMALTAALFYVELRKERRKNVSRETFLPLEDSA
jgi:hypothetical protein